MAIVIAPLFVEMRDASQVGGARRGAMALARAGGMRETDAGSIGIIATELAGNLVRYATEGLLVAQWIAGDDGDGIEIVSIDRGPGIENVDNCMRDGFTTGGTPGTGLGAVRRLSSQFDIHSVPRRGTIVLSRVFAREPEKAPERRFRWGAVCRPIRGEIACGDTWRAAFLPERVSFMVADGLGHGESAAIASAVIAATFDSSSSSSPIEILESAHRQAVGTRGAAASIAEVDRGTGRIRFSGIGNVTSTLVNGSKSKGMFAHNGTIGAQVRKFQSFDYEWPEGAMLVMHSDGLQSRWSLDEYPGLRLRHPTVIAAVLLRDFARDRDDVTVLVVKREG